MSRTRGDIRSDLMKRWFAVAISVGFATTLVHMDWLSNGTWPTYPEWQQLARLFVALTAVIFSWEGYFFSIDSKPLLDTPRFIIDFVLVLLYMVLLYTSKIPSFWLFIHSISFLLFFVWDILSIRLFETSYAGPSERGIGVVSVYVRGMGNDPSIYRGPVITLSWLVYFALLALAYLYFRMPDSFVMAPFAFMGLMGYRLDKVSASKAFKGEGMALRMEARLLIIAGLLGALLLVLHLTWLPL